MNFLSKISGIINPYRVKTPTVLQMEATECGAASLAMVLAYFGRYEPLEKLRSDCGVSRNGSKASLIVKAARSYGLNASGFEIPLEKLDKIALPSILFWDFDHFVVYEGRSRNGKYYYINDPAMGPRMLDKELFEGSYTGVALSFEPNNAFAKGGKPVNVVKAMIPFLQGMKTIMSAIVWGGLLLVIPGITVPTLMRIFVDEVLPGKTQWLVPVLLCFALTVILQICLSFLVKLALRRGELQLAVNKSLEMLNFLFRLPMDFFLQRSTADIQNRLSLNTNVANAAFGTFADNIVKFFTAGFFLVLMFQFSPLLSVVAIAFVLIQVLFFVFINKVRQVLNQSVLMLQTKMQSSLTNGIDMMETVRSLGREDSMFLQWSGQLASLNKKQLKFQIYSSYFNMLPTFLTGVGSILILSLGAYEIVREDLTLGGMFAFQTLMSSFTGPFTSLLLASSLLQTMKADIERINDVYKYDEETIFALENKDDEEQKNTDAAYFEMKNITFGYSRLSEPVLKNFSLKVEAGKRVAVVGSTGSGKTTVAKIANGILKPWSGEILLNGKNISEYTRSQYYTAVGSVDQNIMLFSGSMSENLTLFAPKYDVKELHTAMHDAAIDEDLNARGPLLELAISEGGANFSGGQRQRIEMARALYRRTPLLILDEATSSLDPITEQKIDMAIRRRACACIIIAHRLSTVRDCDEIIMLSNGKIIERGSHDALMNLGKNYAQFMQSEEGG